MRKFIRRLDPKRYYEYKEEVANRNFIASEVFLIVGFIVSTFNIISNLLVKRTNGFSQSILLFAYFVMASIVHKFFLKDKVHRSTFFLYATQFPILIISIFMGTLWDPESVTITFFMLLICMPPFILDNPRRHTLYIVGLMSLYAVADYVTKDSELFLTDMVHASGFLMASIFLNLFVLAERLDNIENYVLSREKARTDEISGLQNRYAYKQDELKYTHDTFYVALIGLDNFKIFNDMFGHEIGEDIFRQLADIILETFDPEICYRYESDEILVIDQPDSEADFNRKLEEIKEKFKQASINGRTIRPSFSVGYVYGEPDDRIELNEMVRHADVRLIEAVNEGRGRVYGFPYDKSEKRITNILTEVSQSANKTNRDALTHLPSMQFFRVRVDEMLENVIDMTKHPVFVYFNIGNFRGYNEVHGFQKGDMLLQNIAGILREEFKDRLMSRFSEDHFVVLAYKHEVEEQLEKVSNRAKTLFGKLDMELKAGIYEYEDGDDIGLACDRAKLACDSLKHNFNKKFEYYTQKLESRNKLAHYVITHVDEAIDNGYIKVYYQPIVDITTGKTIELEALARWIDPVQGFLSPADFIPTLEDARLIHKLDTFMARQICRDQKIITEKAGRDIPVSLNLSRIDFMMTDIVSIVKTSVEEYHVNKRNLHIEITESALIEDEDKLKNKVGDLRSYGFEVWLDDFGSGYSSLNTLQNYNFDVIKVDMQFMRTLEARPETAVIVTSIIDMSKNLGLKSLVEGVETESQYHFLQSIGCNMAQGYLFSKPVPIEELDLSA